MMLLGSISLVTNNNITVTGFAATTAVGTPTFILVNNVHIDGVAATASVGGVTINAKANLVLSLDGATGGVGVVAIWGIIDSSQVPNYSTITNTQDPNWEEVA